MVFWMGPKAPTVLGRYCQDVVTRWQSEAYQRYIRTPRESLAAVWRHLANWLFLCASAQRGLQHSVVVNRNCLRSLVRLEQQLAVESVGGFWWKNSNFTVSSDSSFSTSLTCCVCVPPENPSLSHSTKPTHTTDYKNGIQIYSSHDAKAIFQCNCDTGDERVKLLGTLEATISEVSTHITPYYYHQTVFFWNPHYLLHLSAHFTMRGTV